MTAKGIPTNRELPPFMNAETYKREAAAGALDFVKSGMRLGLGTGSTARHFVELLAERVRAGLQVKAVPTSETTRADAARLGVPLTTLDETPALDVTVDGADEIGPGLVLIKGGGGALLREKIVAAASARMIVIADESKWVGALGRFPLPIEIAPFGGYRFGGDFFELITGQRVDLDGAPAWGATVGVPLAHPGLLFEGLFTHQHANLIVSSPATALPRPWHITVEH